MPAQQQGQEADNSLAALWITIGVFIAGFLIWWFFKVYIIAAVIAIRGYEADIVSLFIPHAWTSKLDAARQFMQEAKAGGYTNVDFEQLATLSKNIGDYLRFPTAVVLAGLAYLIYVTSAIAHYKKTYSMKTLLKDEEDNWPFIMPVTNLDLVSTPLDKGPWAMALQPMSFAKKHNLLIVKTVQPTGMLLASKAIQVASINRDEARKIFAMQVGQYWEGPEKLPTYARALFTIFAGRIMGERDAPIKLLEQIAHSSKTSRLDFSGTDDLLRKYKGNKLVKHTGDRHAFILTAMASMLENARMDGVLPSAEFLWLKVIDRSLWYMLNCVGRQTPYVEVAGPFAHWLAEKELDRKLNVPMIEEAVNGIEAAVKEFIYKPDEEDVQEKETKTLKGGA